MSREGNGRLGHANEPLRPSPLPSSASSMGDGWERNGWMRMEKCLPRHFRFRSALAKWSIPLQDIPCAPAMRRRAFFPRGEMDEERVWDLPSRKEGTKKKEGMFLFPWTNFGRGPWRIPPLVTGAQKM